MSGWRMTITAALAAAMCGCSSMPIGEKVWMLTHALDVAQTVQIARSECYFEDDPVTRGLIGDDPSTGEALAWGVAWGGLHYGVTRMLQEIEAPGWVQAGWQVLTIANTAAIVRHNYDIGIGVTGSEC